MRNLRVVSRRLVVEDKNVFVGFHWHLLSVQVPGSLSFFSNPLIAQFFQIAASQNFVERCLCKQGLTSTWSHHPLYLTPKSVKVNGRIPSAVCRAIWEISKQEVYAIIWHPRHKIQTVPVYQFIVLHIHKRLRRSRQRILLPRSYANRRPPILFHTDRQSTP